MPNTTRSFFDTFTRDEATLMETIMAEVKDAPWAQPILKDIATHGGLCPENMDRFFELRQGYALLKARVATRYEVPGEGDSTLDFGFASSGRDWNVEMMRLNETEGVKAATHSHTAGDGTVWTSRILGLGSQDKKQTSEGETLKAIQRICQKCEKGGKPHKFKVPNSQLNALLVDMRTFQNGGDGFDRIHIALGGAYVPEQYRMYWGEGKDRRLVSGVFSPENSMKGASEARDRMHFIGFVNERTFAPDAYQDAIVFVANPHLFKDEAEMRAAIETWPFKKKIVLNGKPK